MFYTNIFSYLIQNGITSKYFRHQGCGGKGDTILPYLFIFYAGILGILIRNNKDIKGIVIASEEYKIAQYADDTSLMCDGSPTSLDAILRVLDKYAHISGLQINISKTK